MKFLEKNLEDIIYECSQTQEQRQLLVERGLDGYPLGGKLYRQVPLGSYGIADLVNLSITFDVIDKGKPPFRYFSVDLFELKQNTINVEALCQACRYMTAIRSLSDIFNAPNMYDDFSTSVTLIGADIDVSSDFVFLYNEMPDNFNIYTYSYKIDGIKFKQIHRGWAKTHENFSKDMISAIGKPLLSEMRAIYNKH